MRTLVVILVFGIALVYGKSAYAGDGESETYTFDTSFQNSGNYYGNNSIISFDQTRAEHEHLQLFIGRLTRTYPGTPALVDTSFGMGYVSKLGASCYWENSLTFAPDAQIIPVASIITRLHYVSGRSDVSLGMTYNNSPILSSGILSPQYLYQLSDTFTASGTIFAAHAKNNDVAYVAGVILTPSDRHLIRLSYAYGRTIEDVDLEVNFNSIATLYEYRFNKTLRAGPYANFYASDTRVENSFGVKVEITP